MTLLRNKTASFSKFLKKILHPVFITEELGDSRLPYNDMDFLSVEKVSLKAYARLSAADDYSFIAELPDQPNFIQIQLTSPSPNGKLSSISRSL